jgi:hypothetical protein
MVTKELQRILEDVVQISTTISFEKFKPIKKLDAKDASPGHPVLRNYTMVSARGFTH